MLLDINNIGRERRLFDERLRLPDLEGAAGEAIAVPESRLRGEYGRGDRGVDLSGHLDAKVVMACGRCLEPYTSTLAVDFFLTLVPGAAEFAAGEAEVREEDASIFYAEEGIADLEAIASEQIYLNLPLKPVCSDGCRGLCPACGANRNLTECGCRTEAVDPRLAPLLRFKTRRGPS